MLLSFVVYLAVPSFSISFHKRRDFRKESNWIKTACFDFLYILVWTFRILTRIQRDIFINVYNSAYKSIHCCCQILVQPRRLVDRYSRSFINIRFHENSSSGSRLIPCGQRRVTKLIDVFQNFANTLQNSCIFSCDVSITFVRYLKKLEHINIFS